MTAQVYATFHAIPHHRHLNKTRSKDLQRLPKQNSITFKDLGTFQGLSRPWKWNKKIHDCQGPEGTFVLNSPRIFHGQ